MALVKGDNIRFYNAGQRLSLEMDVTLNVTGDTIETRNKDTVGWKTFIGGDKGWTVSGSAHLDWTASENISGAFADIIAGTEIAVDVGSSANSKYYSGNGIVTSWSLEGPGNGIATFSFEVQGTGAITEATTRT